MVIFLMMSLPLIGITRSNHSVTDELSKYLIQTSLAMVTLMYSMNARSTDVVVALKRMMAYIGIWSKGPILVPGRESGGRHLHIIPGHTKTLKKKKIVEEEIVLEDES